MKKHQRRVAPATPQEPDPIHVSLTIDERDAIDGAKGHIRRSTALMVVALRGLSVVNDEDFDERGSWVPDAHEAFEDVLDAIREDLEEIDTAFISADKRTAKQDGGAS